MTTKLTGEYKTKYVNFCVESYKKIFDKNYDSSNSSENDILKDLEQKINKLVASIPELPEAEQYKLKLGVTSFLSQVDKKEKSLLKEENSGPESDEDEDDINVNSEIEKKRLKNLKEWVYKFNTFFPKDRLTKYNGLTADELKKKFSYHIAITKINLADDPKMVKKLDSFIKSLQNKAEKVKKLDL